MSAQRKHDTSVSPMRNRIQGYMVVQLK